jgi:hypothetical protein
VPDAADVVVLQFIELPGLNYTIQMNETVSSVAWSNWFSVSNASTAGIVRVTNSIPSGTSQFYRLKVQGP